MFTNKKQSLPISKSFSNKPDDIVVDINNVSTGSGFVRNSIIRRSKSIHSVQLSKAQIDKIQQQVSKQYNKQNSENNFEQTKLKRKDKILNIFMNQKTRNRINNKLKNKSIGNNLNELDLYAIQQQQINKFQHTDMSTFNAQQQQQSISQLTTSQSSNAISTNLSPNYLKPNQNNSDNNYSSPIHQQQQLQTDESNMLPNQMSNLNSLVLNSNAPNQVISNNNSSINSNNSNNNNSNNVSNLSNSSTSSNTANTTTNSANSSNSGNMSGYLLKWTNYLKGYQKRWISINNGLLSYFRSPNEMDHTCRGAINLANAHIQQSEDGVSFVVSNGTSNQTFHLKASNEIEKQKWLNALDLAKNKAKQLGHNNIGSSNTNPILNNMNQNHDSDDDDPVLEAEKNELETLLQVLKNKLNDLSTSHEFVLKQNISLTKCLTELENIQTKPDEMTIKTINERSTIYKIGMIGVMNHCQEFINLALFQTRKMHKILQSEREMRLRLEEMVQEMAKQQVSFETQLNKRGKRMNRGSLKSSSGSANKQNSSSATLSPISTSENLSLTNNVSKNNQEKTSSENQKQINKEQNKSRQDKIEFDLKNSSQEKDENDEDQFYDDEFHDAVEDVTQFSVTLPRQKGLHQRNPSNMSKLYLQESDVSTDDEDQQTIQVTMQTNKDNEIVEQKPKEQNNQIQKTAVALSKKKVSSNDLNTLKNEKRIVKQRRTQVPPRPNYSINLWGIMKNCIGKDLSKIPIPVNFSEPLSMLQRITEELEYSNLLDKAADCEDQWEQMAYVAAYTITSYSTTAARTNKPFNPLLGETYELDRLDDLGWRSISEQVGHHPPALAMHCESLKDWKVYQEITVSSKFRGQYLQVIPLGTTHCEFKKTGHHYTWRKVATFVRNIIVGKLWIDNVGEMDIINHKTKDVCHLKYFAYSYFSRDPPRKVTGIITDSNNVARYVLNGTWTEQIEGAPVLNPQVVTQQTQLNTGKSKVLWKRKIPPAYLDTMHSFTEFAVQLNELEEGVAPTDSRLRPDQRLMEEGKWDEANQEKLRLEEKQRTVRKQRESSLAQSFSNGVNNNMNSNNLEEDDDNEDINSLTAKRLNSISNTSHDPEPAWFKKSIDPYTNLPIHVFKNEYWDCKSRQDWKRCPDIF